jgi:hypothetical protein
MDTSPEKLIKMHQELVHSKMLKVTSHVQRKNDDWIINTVMIEGCDAPFKFKRKKPYKDLMGKLVNLTYYPDVEVVAGFELEIMSVVRIKIS